MAIGMTVVCPECEEELETGAGDGVGDEGPLAVGDELECDGCGAVLAVTGVGERVTVEVAEDEDGDGDDIEDSDEDYDEDEDDEDIGDEDEEGDEPVV